MTQTSNDLRTARIAAQTIERKAGELRRTAELIEEMLEHGAFLTAGAAAHLAQVLVDEIGKSQAYLSRSVDALKAKHGADV